MCSGLLPRLIVDLSQGSLMWVRYIKNFNFDFNCLQLLEIHISSEKDIEGGGWNHGKFGRGQTSVIK